MQFISKHLVKLNKKQNERPKTTIYKISKY